MRTHQLKAYKMEDPHVPFWEEVQAIVRQQAAHIWERAIITL